MTSRPFVIATVITAMMLFESIVAVLVLRAMWRPLLACLPGNAIVIRVRSVASPIAGNATVLGVLPDDRDITVIVDMRDEGVRLNQAGCLQQGAAIVCVATRHGLVPVSRWNGALWAFLVMLSVLLVVCAQLSVNWLVSRGYKRLKSRNINPRTLVDRDWWKQRHTQVALGRIGIGFSLVAVGLLQGVPVLPSPFLACASFAFVLLCAVEISLFPSRIA